MRMLPRAAFVPPCACCRGPRACRRTHAAAGVPRCPPAATCAAALFRARRASGVYGDGVTVRLIVLVSGTGTNLQALLSACAEEAYGAQVVAVGADRLGITGLDRAARAGVPTFAHQVADYPAREDWDRALAQSCAAFEPDLVVSAAS